MKGAKDVLAIDIDEWSVENSKENAERNNVELRIELGTAENLGKEKFDIILANINRNILISDIPTYVKDMNQGSELLLSGLCFFDVDDFRSLHRTRFETQKQTTARRMVQFAFEK
jgi:ribosomal protein L11 methyltransferase